MRSRLFPLFLLFVSDYLIFTKQVFDWETFDFSEPQVCLSSCRCLLNSISMKHWANFSCSILLLVQSVANAIDSVSEFQIQKNAINSEICWFSLLLKYWILLLCNFEIWNGIGTDSLCFKTLIRWWLWLVLLQWPNIYLPWSDYIFGGLFS